MIDTDLFFGIESPGTQISIIPLYQHSSNDQLLDFKLHPCLQNSNWKEEEKELQLKFHFRAIILY